MHPHLEQLIRLQVSIVEALIFLQLALQLLILNGEIINDASVIFTATIIAVILCWPIPVSIFTIRGRMFGIVAVEVALLLPLLQLLLMQEVLLILFLACVM